MSGLKDMVFKGRSDPPDPDPNIKNAARREAVRASDLQKRQLASVNAQKQSRSGRALLYSGQTGVTSGSSKNLGGA